MFAVRLLDGTIAPSNISVLAIEQPQVFVTSLNASLQSLLVTHRPGTRGTCFAPSANVIPASVVWGNLSCLSVLSVTQPNAGIVYLNAVDADSWRNTMMIVWIVFCCVFAVATPLAFVVVVCWLRSRRTHNDSKAKLMEDEMEQIGE